MGRETKLLLGLLATLFGVFVGVLSMKLLVPRPPAGAGPDVQADLATAEPQDLVEPPRFAAESATRPPTPRPPATVPPSQSRFAAAPRSTAEETRDPFVTRASFNEPALAPPPPSSPVMEPAAFEQVAAAAPPMAGTAYVAQPGDSWWSLAEQAYGDGRVYRALFAWNRRLDPRVSLVVGTPIELPHLDRLAAAWPALMPVPQ
jgi:nucleoid-associated protein YgaU